MKEGMIGGSIGNKYRRVFTTDKDETLWNDIYIILGKYGGFFNQSDATDELFHLHGKQIHKKKIK